MKNVALTCVPANAASTDIVLTPATYTPHIGVGVVIGTLTTVDPNCCQSFTVAPSRIWPRQQQSVVLTVLLS